MPFGHGAPQHPEFPAISFICAVFILLPVTSHWKAGNVATLSMIAWLFVVNFYRFINTLIWANNVDERLPVWCDITTKLTVGVTIALPAAALCICRYLEAVASVRWARQTDTQKRNRKIFELFMCFGLPIIVMALHYLSQGHRYDIYEHMGCQPTTVITWVALLVLYIPPLLLSIIAAVYAGLAVRHFYRRRVDFKKHLSQSNAGITPSRYLRLMLLALTEMVFDTSINIYVLWLNITQWRGLVPYISWDNIHFHFSRVQQFPELLIPPTYWVQLVAIWYVIPVATFLFWIFFAFGQESIAEYKSWWNWVQRKVLRRQGILPLGSSQAGSATRVGARWFGGSSSKSNSKSDSGSKGPRIHIPFPSARGKTARKMDDDDSFVSADDSRSEIKQPISPISPTDIASTPHLPTGLSYSSPPPPPMSGIAVHYVEPELDTSVFDTISHITVSEPENDPDHGPILPTHVTRPSQSSPSLRLGVFSPMSYPEANNSGTFANTAVRPNTPNVHTNSVRVGVEVATDVV